jgi:hypothetical protein
MKIQNSAIWMMNSEKFSSETIILRSIESNIHG